MSAEAVSTSPPPPDLALKFGDKLTVVGEKEGLKGLARLLGNNAKKLSDTDFFPIAMGIVLGVLFGKLNISFPGGLSFSPGLTGGILIVALFLSAVGKTGPIIWSMSGPANQLLRQLGLLLFLAEVGTSAGKNLVATFQESGWLLFGVGAAITLVPMLIAVIAGRLFFKISIHPRFIGNPYRRHDEYSRPGSRRLHDGQQYSECGLCYGVSYCDGVPHIIHPNYCNGDLRR